MANANQVIVNGETILDLRSDTVTPETLQKGYTAHDKSGAQITGTLEVPATEEQTVELSMPSGNQVIQPTSGKVMSKVTVQKPATLLPENIKKDVVIGGVTGTLEGGGSANIQESKSVTITSNGTTTVTPDTGYDALGKVDVTTNVMSGGEESCKLKINVTAPPSDDPEWALYICPGRLDSEEIVLDANNPSAEISIPSKGPFVLYTKNGNYIDSVSQDWGFFDYLDEASGYIALKYSGANTYVCYAGDTGTGTWDIQFY